jgi:alkylation response protein AidB-like acyl-CoA dehydrogenase
VTSKTPPPASLANLKPFRPGPDKRRNVKGRPKLPDIREALAKVLAEEKDGITALEATLRALRAKATKGDVRAAEALLDRAFGKAVQRTDVTSGDKPIATPPIAWIPVPHVEPPR